MVGEIGKFVANRVRAAEFIQPAGIDILGRNHAGIGMVGHCFRGVMGDLSRSNKSIAQRIHDEYHVILYYHIYGVKEISIASRSAAGGHSKSTAFGIVGPRAFSPVREMSRFGGDVKSGQSTVVQMAGGGFFEHDPGGDGCGAIEFVEQTERGDLTPSTRMQGGKGDHLRVEEIEGDRKALARFQKLERIRAMKEGGNAVPGEPGHI